MHVEFLIGVFCLSAIIWLFALCFICAVSKVNLKDKNNCEEFLIFWFLLSLLTAVGFWGVKF